MVKFMKIFNIFQPLVYLRPFITEIPEGNTKKSLYEKLPLSISTFQISLTFEQNIYYTT